MSFFGKFQTFTLAVQELLAPTVCFGKRRGHCPAPWLGLVTPACSPGVPSWTQGSDLGGCRARQRLPHLGSLGAGADEEQVGHLTGVQGYLYTSPALGAAGTVFGTEGLNRVKLLIKAVLGSWLWDLLVTELALHQKPGRSKRLVGISFLAFSPKAVC